MRAARRAGWLDVWGFFPRAARAADAVDPQRRAGADRAQRTGDQPARGGARMRRELRTQSTFSLGPSCASLRANAHGCACHSAPGGSDAVGAHGSDPIGVGRSSWSSPIRASRRGSSSSLPSTATEPSSRRTAEHARMLAGRCPPRLAVLGDLDSPRGALELLEEIRRDRSRRAALGAGAAGHRDRCERE